MTNLTNLTDEQVDKLIEKLLATWLGVDEVIIVEDAEGEIPTTIVEWTEL